MLHSRLVYCSLGGRSDSNCAHVAAIGQATGQFRPSLTIEYQASRVAIPLRAIMGDMPDCEVVVQINTENVMAHLLVILKSLKAFGLFPCMELAAAARLLAFEPFAAQKRERETGRTIGEFTDEDFDAIDSVARPQIATALLDEYGVTENQLNWKDIQAVRSNLMLALMLSGVNPSPSACAALYALSDLTLVSWDGFSLNLQQPITRETVERLAQNAALVIDYTYNADTATLN